MEDLIRNVSYTKTRDSAELVRCMLSIVQEDYVVNDLMRIPRGVSFCIQRNTMQYHITSYLNRVHDNGFPNNNRPEIKRIQVRPIEGKTDTSSDSCFLLCGVVYYLDNPEFVVWNPSSFVGFEKNRSAYVSVYSLKKAYDNGFYFGSDCGTNIYVCKRGYFKELIEKYIKDTIFEEIEW